MADCRPRMQQAFGVNDPDHLSGSTMRAVHFTEEVLNAIRHDRYHHPHPKVQQKMEVLWLKSKGLSHGEIAAYADISIRSVVRHLTEFLEGGLERVRQLGYGKGPSELDQHKGELEAYFLENQPRSAVHAQAEILRLTGVQRGLTQVRHFLKKISV